MANQPPKNPKPQAAVDQTQPGWSSEGLAYLKRSEALPRLYVVRPYEQGRSIEGRSPEARLAEAVGLAQAISAELVGSDLAPLKKIRPASYIGPGKMDELHEFAESADIDVFIFDCALSPIQQRNLEKGLKRKVIDRTALILEIFGDRASTKEGELQVELAHLTYQKSRLVRSWTHLERQRGGAGFMGGPGETQIEADRRMIDERIGRIKKRLEDVTRTRTLHRARRQKAPYPVVALVGYTNAGKSTLFNRLTNADVMAEDMLFATLDPTLRAINLPSGRRIILSDTVGFISELPTLLVAAFRATLEEVLEANIIIHVRDASHPDTEEQRDDVLAVLEDLGIDLDQDIEGTPMIEALNKSDALDENGRAYVAAQCARSETMTQLSGLTGAGCPDLLTMIDAALGAEDREETITLDYSEGRALAWLKANTKILSEDINETGVTVTLKSDPLHWARFVKQFRPAEFDALVGTNLDED